MTTQPDVDPRIERTRRVVLDAAAELIGECGMGRTSIEAISERCGVARSTIYRHWPDRSNLLRESVQERMKPIDDTETGDLRTDLLNVYQYLGLLLSDPETGPLVASCVAESKRNPEIAALLAKSGENRHKASSRIIRKAIDRGDLPSETDADQMADDLGAGVFFRALIRNQPVDEAWIETHVDRYISVYAD